MTELPHIQSLPPGFKVTSWESLEPHLTRLLHLPIRSAAELEAWLLEVSDWEALIYEEKAWRHIRVTCHTHEEEAIKDHAYWAEQVLPQVQRVFFQIEKRAVESPYLEQLAKDAGFDMVRRIFQSQMAVFREENVALMAESSVMSRRFDRIMGSLSIHWKGKDYTMAMASQMLEGEDREERRQVWQLMMAARASVTAEMHQLLTDLMVIRHQMARNAGHDGFASFIYAFLGRLDYGREEVARFRDAIAEVLRPLYEEQLMERRRMLGVESLKPYDMQADLFGGKPLRPFEGQAELADKSIKALSRVSPRFGEMLEDMRQRGLLDLDSRLGKAPGGYNYPLPLSGAPFIFMNATGSWADVVTMMHEAGHAVHACLNRHLRLYPHRHVPSELAELASMSMELLALDALVEFYPDAGQLRRAQLEQLNRMVVLLPWIATIDHFQHWIADHEGHTWEERNEAWGQIYARYHGDVLDWSDDMATYRHMWQRQGHIFRSPFYYIEYGLAQLGAVAVWRNFRQDPERALRQFEEALSLGYSRSMPEVYAAAGIKFDFSSDYIRELMHFAAGEISRIKGGN